jgi:hypothetical protein
VSRNDGVGKGIDNGRLRRILELEHWGALRPAEDSLSVGVIKKREF